MLYRVLGELTIGPLESPVKVPGGKVSRILSALLLRANRLVTLEQLQEAGWGDDQPISDQLPKAISTVKELLSGVGTAQIQTLRGRGYKLTVDPDQVDMLRFQRLVEQSSRLNDPDAEAEQLNSALELWRGSPPLSNVSRAPFPTDLAALMKRRARAEERFLTLRLAAGRVPEILDRLVIAVEQDHKREKLCELLMLAYHLTGQAAQAQTTFERYAHALDSEYNASPDRKLLTLCYSIMNDAAVAEQRLAELGYRPPETSDPTVLVPQEIPPSVPWFAGRADLVDEAVWQLKGSRAALQKVVISGSSGMGKTELARRVAELVREDYPDGGLFLELRDTDDEPVDTSEVLAQALRGLTTQRLPDTRAHRLSLYRDILSNRRVLVVLDNAVSEDQVRDLLPRTRNCGVIVTSRRALPDLDGVHPMVPLGLLSSAETNELYERVLRGHHSQLTHTREDMERLVTLCGGMPLAVRIVASLRLREPGRSTAEFVNRLAAAGTPAMAIGSRSVTRALETGFQGLTLEARQLFVALGRVRLSHFGAWTAAAVLGPQGDPGAALSDLLSCFIAQPTTVEGRYRFHDLTRDHAQRLSADDAASPEHGARIRQVYAALLTLVRRAHRGLYGGDFEVVHSDVPDWAAPQSLLEEIDRDPQAWYEAERRNIRAAVAHAARLGFSDLAWDLAFSSQEFYALSGYYDDWRVTHTAALDACRTAGDLRGEGVMLTAQSQPALVASRRAGVESAIPSLRRAVELLTACGDEHGVAIAQRTLGNALRREGRLAEPLTLFREALRRYEGAGDTLGCWQTSRFIGQTLLDLGEHSEALTSLIRARRAADALGQARVIAQSAYWVGRARLALGQLDEARHDFDTVAGAAGQTKGSTLAYALHGHGDLARLRGSLAEADETLAWAGRLAAETADAVLEGRVHLSRAELFAALARPTEQVAALEHAARCFAACGSPYLEAVSYSTLVEVLRQQGLATDDASAQVERLHHLMDLPLEDQIHLYR
ncbi:BTAD domain-containing putative transcriptional regulator [Longispora sp. NPDC051575]|uniref:AfsR/SARP family transcriptional regulator n=1 Tax=Longispora sp. NPDC051575 TaxID=3154943 RepID=UPI00344A900D